MFRRRRPIRIARARSSIEAAATSGSGGGGGISGGVRWPMLSKRQPILRGPTRLYQYNNMADGVVADGVCGGAGDDRLAPAQRSLSYDDLKRVDPMLQHEDRLVIPLASCSGPEFIVKSRLPVHRVVLCRQPKKVSLIRHLAAGSVTTCLLL